MRQNCKIRTAFDKIASEGMLEGEIRGSHGKQKKVPEEAKACIRKHKEMFPMLLDITAARNKEKHNVIISCLVKIFQILKCPLYILKK